MTFFRGKHMKYNSDEVFILLNGYFIVKIIEALEHLNTNFDVSLVVDRHFRVQKYEIELLLASFMKIHFSEFWFSETNVYRSKMGIHNYFNALPMIIDNFLQKQPCKSGDIR